MGNTWNVNSNAEMNDWEKLIIYRDNKPVFTAYGHQTSQYGNFLETLTGWWGSPGANRQYGLERPYGGLTSSPVVCGARTITLTGWSYCQDDVSAIRTARNLPGDIFLSDGKVHSYALETYGFETTLWAPVELDGAFISNPVTYQREVEWQIPLRTLTPYVYGPLQTIQVVPHGTKYGLQFPLFKPGYLDWGESRATKATIWNEGNQPAWPKVTLTGNSPAGCRIGDNRGHSVVYRGPIGSVPITLDFEAGQVTTSAGDTNQLVTKRNWWSVPPNTGVLPIITPLQEDTVIYATIELRSAYL